jgi:hypothetical protein
LKKITCKKRVDDTQPTKDKRKLTRSPIGTEVQLRIMSAVMQGLHL